MFGSVSLAFLIVTIVGLVLLIAPLPFSFRFGAVVVAAVGVVGLVISTSLESKPYTKGSKKSKASNPTPKSKSTTPSHPKENDDETQKVTAAAAVNSSSGGDGNSNSNGNNTLQIHRPKAIAAPTSAVSSGKEIAAMARTPIPERPIHLDAAPQPQFDRQSAFSSCPSQGTIDVSTTYKGSVSESGTTFSEKIIGEYEFGDDDGEEGEEYGRVLGPEEQFGGLLQFPPGMETTFEA